MQPATFSRHVEGDVDRFLHVAEPLGEHLPHLCGDQLAEPLLVPDEQLTGPVQQFTPARRGQAAPVGEGGTCRGHGPVHICLLGKGGLGDHQTVVGRIEAVETLARL